MSNPILPLIILLVVVAIFAAIGYIAWSTATEVTRNTRSRMEKKNVMFSRDGMKVGVKEIQDEEYKDRSQSVLVNMWNHTSFPAYKSKIWDMSGPAAGWSSLTSSSSSSGGKRSEGEKRKAK
ncbi:hypothetical protein P168DRAFT_314346 [Aspergillus campestris IBT 28561]|uniref:Uncharacterized protein n=1 Tax=Aspergillus campestris (strain IBT 28561) TaxID=1392248 RepID=A0A2I1DEB6_ASPC2|nr:uncharacterized protein P168DRAFT_314346 [Aspergillus campestris IBT 28561]PKY08223.1 hypothetical protein P168DRAFT_314346 [Aspergillus campestris IBT 28561]